MNKTQGHQLFAKNIKIASVIITHNRVAEAKAQMDIIRELWQPLFTTVDIYHEFNGKKAWYLQKYREDYLHRHKPMPHFDGANHMISQGIKHALSAGKKYDYIVVASADTWFYNGQKLKKIILAMARGKYQLTTSLWGVMALGTEFFIITPQLAKAIFPLKLTALIGRSNLVEWAHSKIALFETLFTIAVIRALKNPNKIYLVPGRKAVWTQNRFFSPHFYASHHDLDKRKKDLLPKIFSLLGSKIEKMPALTHSLR